MVEITLNEVTKIYDDAQGTETAVDNVSLTVDEGELLALVGPSGCGKSTTLRLIAGLETVTNGTIEFDNSEVQYLTPAKREVAMVFQNYALYTKMTGEENIGYGLRHSSDLSESERQEKVREAANLLGIEDLLDDRPAEMSGGQKQRIALGRAIVRDPAVFLLDEPLSNLDAKRRAQMRTEVQRIHQEIDVATVYVTHDQKEAMTMADRLAVMNDGNIEQIAPPEVAYDDPNNLFVATFLGSPAMNIIKCQSRPNDGQIQLEYLPTNKQVASVPADTVPEAYRNATIDVGIRPEDIEIAVDPEELLSQAQVLMSEYQGKENFVYLDFEEEQLIARNRGKTNFNHGQDVSFTVTPRNVYLFDPKSGEALKTRNSIREPTIAD